MRVESHSLLVTQPGLLVGQQDIFLIEVRGGVVQECRKVCRVSGNKRRQVVSLDTNVLDVRIVVTVVLDILGVPVDGTTSPLDRTQSIQVGSGRPQRKLDSGGSGWVVVSVLCQVPGVGSLQGTHDVSVDDPLSLVLGPVDLVVVVVLVGVGGGVVLGVGVVQQTEGVEVSLGLLQVVTHELVINFILDIRESNESSDHTNITRGLDGGTNSAEPQVLGGRDNGTSRLVGHLQQKSTIGVVDVASVHPVGLRSVTQVLVDVHDLGGVGHQVLERRHTGLGHTSSQVERVSGVTSTQTVESGTTHTVLVTAWSTVWTFGGGITRNGVPVGGLGQGIEYAEEEKCESRLHLCGLTVYF